MKRRKKKSAKSEYPQFAFRISSEAKTQLKARLESLKAKANKDNVPDDEIINMNDILIDAINIGLDSLERKFRK